MDLRLVTTPDANNPNVHDLYLDDSGQLAWLGGDITDGESYARMIAQRIDCRLKLVRGEWYLDQRVGTPWREKIWRKGVSEERVTAVFREAIRTTPGVASVRSVSVSIDKRSRTALVSFEATSNMGTEVTSDLLDSPMVVEAIY